MGFYAAPYLSKSGGGGETIDCSHGEKICSSDRGGGLCLIENPSFSKSKCIRAMIRHIRVANYFLTFLV